MAIEFQYEKLFSTIVYVHAWFEYTSTAHVIIHIFTLKILYTFLHEQINTHIKPGRLLLSTINHDSNEKTPKKDDINI